MTLTDILKTLRTVDTESLILQVDAQSGTLTNLNGFRKAVWSIARIPGFGAISQPVLNSIIFKIAEDQFNARSRAELQSSAFTLYTAASSLQLVLASVLPEPSDDSIRFKFPPSPDYKGLLEDQLRLHRIVELLVRHPSINGETKVTGWENGSLWIVLCVGGPIVVSLLGSAAWAAAVIRKKWYEGDILREAARAIGAKAEVIEHLAEKSKEAADALIHTEALALYDKYYSGEDRNEQVGRIQLALKEFAEMIHRGAEIRPALMEPEKAENLFPNFKALDTIPSKIPALGDSSDGQC